MEKLLDDGRAVSLPTSLESKKDLLLLLAAVDHEDLELVLGLFLIDYGFDVPVVGDEHGSDLLEVVEVLALLNHLEYLILLLLLLLVLLLLLCFNLVNEAIGIPVAVNELSSNLFEVGLPVAELHDLDDLLVPLLFQLELILLLFLYLVFNFGIVPVALTQVHLGRVVVSIKQLTRQLEAHIILLLLLLLLLVLFLRLLLLLLVKDALELFIHLGVLILFLLLDLIVDNLLRLLLPLEHLLGLGLLGQALRLDLRVVQGLEGRLRGDGGSGLGGGGERGREQLFNEFEINFL